VGKGEAQSGCEPRKRQEGIQCEESRRLETTNIAITSGRPHGHHGNVLLSPASKSAVVILKKFREGREFSITGMIGDEVMLVGSFSSSSSKVTLT